MPGDLVSARVTYGAPHHLIADEWIGVRRRTGMAEATGVLLGMPSVRT
jgi:hypothetical protein